MSSLESQLNNVNKAILRQISKASYRVVVSVALLIANKSVPKAPVDTGHLRNSSVILASRGGTAYYSQKKYKVIRHWDKEYEESAWTGLTASMKGSPYPQAVVAFIASYAIQVHEGNPNKNWNDGGPKFLEKGVSEAIPSIPIVTKKALSSSDKLTIDDNLKGLLDKGHGKK